MPVATSTAAACLLLACFAVGAGLVSNRGWTDAGAEGGAGPAEEGRAGPSSDRPSCAPDAAAAPDADASSLGVEALTTTEPEPPRSAEADDCEPYGSLQRDPTLAHRRRDKVRRALPWRRAGATRVLVCCTVVIVHPTLTLTLQP